MTAPPRPRRPDAPPGIAHFEVFGYPFSVTSHSTLALQFLSRLYGSFVVEDARPLAQTFSLFSRVADRGRAWEVLLGDQRRQGASSLGTALNQLEYEICLRIVAHHPDLIVLHGATVLTREGAAFISGPSGAGKTTLSLALAARGYRVGGDDVALLDPRNSTIRAVPRCFHLDARSRRLLRDAGLAMPSKALRYAFLTPTDLGMTETPSLPIRLIFSLSRGGGRTPHLAALNQAEAIVRLLSETLRGPRSAAEVMALLVPLVGAASRYQLVGGRLSDTAEAVASILGPA